MNSEVEQATEEVAAKTNQLLTYLQDRIPTMIGFGLKVILTILFFILGRLLIKFIRRVVHKSLTRSSCETGVVQFIDSLIKYGLYVLLVFLIISSFGVDSTAIAAVVGSAGVAIGLALQGSLSNFAGGVLILLLRPFKVGDYIIEHEHNQEGTVKEIQIFYTKLNTVDNQTVVIPNGKLTNNSLTNVTAMNERQLDLRIGVSYEADLLLAKSVLEQLLKREQRVLPEKEVNVFVDQLGDHAILLGIRAWVRSEDFLAVKWQLLEDIKLAFDKQGIALAYPQLDVHLDR